MQRHALDHLGQVISAHRAQRQKNYVCLECRQHVRLRKGVHRQPHFYHLEPILFCRQHQKGAVHLQLQEYFFEQLPLGDCQLEVPFPSIGRIADVAWLSRKIVFEIQCSAIRAEEALARNRDYQTVGWSVVWILHDQRFNQYRLSAVELSLRSSPHYFCTIEASGNVLIYDQFDLCDRAYRRGRLPSLPIDVKQGISFDQPDAKKIPLFLLQLRATHWPYYFSGDLMSHFLKDNCSNYLMLAKEKEAQLVPERDAWPWLSILSKIWRCAIAGPYQIIFRYLLERACR